MATETKKTINLVFKRKGSACTLIIAGVALATTARAIALEWVRQGSESLDVALVTPEAPYAQGTDEPVPMAFAAHWTEAPSVER